MVAEATELSRDSAEHLFRTRTYVLIWCSSIQKGFLPLTRGGHHADCLPTHPLVPPASPCSTDRNSTVVSADLQVVHRRSW